MGLSKTKQTATDRNDAASDSDASSSDDGFAAPLGRSRRRGRTSLRDRERRYGDRRPWLRVRLGVPRPLDSDPGPPPFVAVRGLPASEPPAAHVRCRRCDCPGNGNHFLPGAPLPDPVKQLHQTWPDLAVPQRATEMRAAQGGAGRRVGHFPSRLFLAGTRTESSRDA